MSMLPDAKQIRRADLQTGDESSQVSTRASSPDGLITSWQQAKLAALYEYTFEEALHESDGGAPPDEVEETQIEQPAQLDDESSYAFRLFSSAPGSGKAKAISSTKVTDNVQQITISSPYPVPEGVNTGGFLSSRDLSYYLTSSSSDWNTRRHAQFSDPSVAVSGARVTAQSQLPNRGLALPWRSSTIKVSKKRISLLNDMEPKAVVCVVDSVGERKKIKPNKKRRIMLRERQRKEEAAKLQKQRTQEDREKEEKEKRTKRNREKKVKKKEKLKAKKAQIDLVLNDAQVEAVDALA